MGIGAYRHLVTFEQTLDPPTWHCSIESAASQVVDGLTPFFVTGPYHPGITLETRILFEDGRKLQVQSLSDPEERHVKLVLMCVEVVGRGREPVTH